MWWLAALAVGLISLAHTAPFPFLLEYVGPGRSVWHAPSIEGGPIIYLTYDDGPNADATPALLEVLEREGVTATFFVIPRHVTEDTADIVRRAVDDGHMIALHSHTRGMLLKSRDELSQLLADQADEIERLSGHRPCPLFRPHAGWRGGELYAGLDRARLHAGWLELRDVGLELVACRPAGPARAPARRSRLRRRHRRDARWTSRQSARRPAAHGPGDSGAHSVAESTRIQVWEPVRGGSKGSMSRGVRVRGTGNGERGTGNGER